MNDRCQIVIPARLGSSRLPEKLLLRAGGKSILQYTYEAASRARLAGGVIVAVDHPRLAEEVESFGGHYLMTSTDLASGTDRVAEVARQLPEPTILVNVQGDEPEIDPAAIDRVARALIDDPQAVMSTAGTPIRESSTLGDPSCVKIVMGQRGRAVYFSRAAVPHWRAELTAEVFQSDPPLYWHHIGLYAYRRDFLQWFSEQPPGQLELAERLEQLRAVEAGMPIVVTPVESAAAGIDTPEDFAAFCRRIENRESR